jgi:hypothetical protein
MEVEEARLREEEEGVAPVEGVDSRCPLISSLAPIVRNSGTDLKCVLIARAGLDSDRLTTS